MSLPLYERALEAARFIGVKTQSHAPRVAVVLGSGLSAVADPVEESIEINYAEIPHFVTSTVDGHAGKMVFGSWAGVPVAVMKGRFHLYEGYSMEEVTFPIRVFAVMGVRSLILTNAAGSTSPQISPGSLMAITDHINLMGESPLRGPNDERFGPRFPDMSTVYTPGCIGALHEAAREAGVVLAEGVYAGLYGPNYETPAEVRMLRDLGADALGMSTVAEAIVARHCGLNLLAVSCITNTAAGLATAEIEHSEVMRIGQEASHSLSQLITRVLPRLLSA